MFKSSMKSLRQTSLILLGLSVLLSPSTAYSAAPAKAIAGDKYCGLFKQQGAGGTDSFRVTRSAGDVYRFQMHGVYLTNLGGNFGDIDCKTKIVNNLAVLKQKGWKDAGLWISFSGDMAQVVQLGGSSDLSLGNNVNLTGIYRRTTSGGVKPKALPFAMSLKGVHFEKEDGSLAFDGTFEDGYSFKEERAVVSRRGKKGYIDTHGRLVVPYRFDDAHDFYEGLAAVSIDGKKWGYIDTNGNYVIKPIYDYAWDFSENRGVVAINEKYFWVDKTEAKDTDKTWDRVLAFSDGLAPVQKGDLWGLVNTRGEEVFPIKYSEILRFKDGLASFKDKWNKHGYIDKTGKEVISPLYDKAEDFSEGLACVQTKERFGFIDKTGAKVIPDQFSEVFGAFSNGKCYVRRVGSPYITVIDKTGKQIQQLPLQITDIATSGPLGSTIICHSLDCNFDSGGHDVPLKNYKPIAAFASKDVKAWSDANIFVVSGPAPSVKTAK